MPTFTVTDPQTGQSLDLEGDSAPTEQELDEVFGQLRPTQPAQPQIKLSPYEQAVNESMAAGKGRPQTGMEPGSEFLTAIAQDPGGFVKSLPRAAMAAVTAPGKLAYETAADVISSIDSRGAEYGGNLAAMTRGEDRLPSAAFLAETAKTNPALTTGAKFGQSMAEMAPLGALRFAPAMVNRLLAAGFSAQMIAGAPEQFKNLAEEMNKPKDEQDPDKLTSLWNDVIQTGVFAPLAGAGAFHPSAPAPRWQGPMATGEVLEMPKGASRPVEPPPEKATAPAPTAPIERTSEQVAADAAAPNPEYSPEDWVKYQDLQAQLAVKITPENMAEQFARKPVIQKEWEALKNKYGGKSPAQLSKPVEQSAPDAALAAEPRPAPAEVTATAKPPKPAPEKPVKEPWQMTRAEWLNSQVKEVEAKIQNANNIKDEASRKAALKILNDQLESAKTGKPVRVKVTAQEIGPRGNPQNITRTITRSDVANFHKLAIEDAIREGKPVPSEVISDYPDIIKTFSGLKSEKSIPAPAPKSDDAAAIAKKQQGELPGTMQGRTGTFGEPTGPRLTDAEISAYLQKEHGIKTGGVVTIINDPANPATAEIGFDPVTKKPTAIRVNRANVTSTDDLNWAIEHEASHWFDLEHPDVAGQLRSAVSDTEWRDIHKDIWETGYHPSQHAAERTAMGIQALADAWKGRNWFQKIVGNVMRFATERLGMKMSRSAAESVAARAITQSIKRISEAQLENVEPEMQIARQLPSMSFDEFKTKANSFNNINLKLGRNATADQAAELRALRDQANLRQQKALEAYSKAQTPETQAELEASMTMPQFYNEALHQYEAKHGGVMQARMPQGFDDAVKKASEYVRDVAEEEFKAPKMTPLRGAVLEWSAKLQRSFGEAEAKQRSINRRVPDQTRQAGITNWIQADGDPKVLTQRLADTLAWRDPVTGKPHPQQKQLVQGYQAALSLTPEEIAVANEVRGDYSDGAVRGRAANVLDTLKDNYLTQIWNLKKGPSGGASGRTLKERFRFSRASTFPTFFDGEQAGYIPKSKAIGKLLPVYLHEMNSTIAGRELVDQISRETASDGRPLVSPQGDGVPVRGDNGDATLVLPKAIKGDTADYKVMNGQPALQKWKWISKDTDGNPIFLKADLALHPEAYKKLNAILGRSAIREWYSTRTTALAEIPKAIVHGIDAANSATKRTMLGLASTFHQVQTGTHAVGHRVNPFFNIPKIDLVHNAEQMDAAKHGLMMLPDKASENQFMEGFRTSGLVSHIPVIGPAADWYGHYLFAEYIPGLKFKTYQAILERNQSVYAKDLAAGRVTAADVKVLSSEQANAAYGHLNYADIGRNPTIQHFAQLGLLAPDFLEARARFTGQAIKGLTGAKVGREQLLALATLAIAQATGAYVSAKLTGGEWDKKNPFAFHLGNRSYTLRSVPEDTMQLLTNTRQFTHNRLSPIIGKGALQYATGVDYAGRKVSAGQTTKELLEQPVPISARGFLGLSGTTLTGMEQLAGAVGLKISRYSPAQEVRGLLDTWRSKQTDPKIQEAYERSKVEVYAPSPYSPLRRALENGDTAAAQSEYAKLRGVREYKVIRETLKPKPLTGSLKTEKPFMDSLNAEQRKAYDAAKAEQQRIYDQFMAMHDKGQLVSPAPKTNTVSAFQQ
jgi:hypothetical protein